MRRLSRHRRCLLCIRKRVQPFIYRFIPTKSRTWPDDAFVPSRHHLVCSLGPLCGAQRTTSESSSSEFLSSLRRPLTSLLDATRTLMIDSLEIRFIVRRSSLWSLGLDFCFKLVKFLLESSLERMVSFFLYKVGQIKRNQEEQRAESGRQSSLESRGSL